VVHRDLKPANVMLRTDGEPMVMDFGIARSERHQTSLTASGCVLGTPMYLAPEQIAGGRSSTLSDQYALGVTAFELLTGRQPLVGTDTMAVVYARLVQDTPSVGAYRSDLPETLVAIIDRMSSPRPADRYADLGQVGEALRGVG
jgi:serine/threonine-protein kinase